MFFGMVCSTRLWKRGKKALNGKIKLPGDQYTESRLLSVEPIGRPIISNAQTHLYFLPVAIPFLIPGLRERILKPLFESRVGCPENRGFSDGEPPFKFLPLC